jgi:hypothetical protein
VDLDSMNSDLVPGLSVNGRINIFELDECYNVPLECIFEEDSIKIVYELVNSNFVRKKIQIEDQNDDYGIIRGEFADKITLALDKPYRFNENE